MMKPRWPVSASCKLESTPSSVSSTACVWLTHASASATRRTFAVVRRAFATSATPTSTVSATAVTTPRTPCIVPSLLGREQARPVQLGTPTAGQGPVGHLLVTQADECSTPPRGRPARPGARPCPAFLVMPQPNILLVEADKKPRDKLADVLPHRGYFVTPLGSPPRLGLAPHAGHLCRACSTRPSRWSGSIYSSS